MPTRLLKLDAKYSLSSKLADVNGTAFIMSMGMNKIVHIKVNTAYFCFVAPDMFVRDRFG
jgi:hypothetical protein